MKIQTTSLSMDASSSHKEMATEVKQFGEMSEWKVFLDEDDMKSHLSMDSTSFDSEKKPIRSKNELRQSAEKENESVGWADIDKIVTEGKGIASQVLAGNAVERMPGGDGGEVQRRLLNSSDHILVRESRAEFEFSSHGRVQTVDGRSVDFSLSFSEVQQVSEIQYSRKTLPLWDPLTLSFSGSAPVLSDSAFAFDLNSDGTKEHIPSLSPTSGFLALDKNGDGKINDGSELFGPLSGSGYDELQSYDVDGNLWIDENDPVFSELKIWVGAGSGDEKLISLKEAGVGALSLASVATDFDMKSPSGEVLGKISRSGLFLMENGEAKSMVEINVNTRVGQSKDSLHESFFSNDISGEDLLLQALRKAILRLEGLIEERHRRIEVESQYYFDVKKITSLKEKFWSWQEKK